MKQDVKYEKVKYCECQQVNIYKSLIDNQKKQITELTCEIQHLKDAVAKAQILGVPLHHLSHDIGRHFEQNTKCFTAITEAAGVLNFAGQLHVLTMDDCPEDVSDDMLIGWKSGIVDARKAAHNYHDTLLKIAENKK